MKKSFLLFVVFAIALLLLENCKRDPKIELHNTNSDPDSLYTGTKYAYPPLFQFPTIHNAYKDSMTYEGIQLGRRLFYDKHLSLDGQKSCGSCHKALYALSDEGNAKSINEFGTTKRNAPAIQNLAWAPSLFWDGRQPTLAAQAQDAYQHELGLNVAGAISYLKTDSTYTRLFRKAFGRPGDITENKIYLAVQQFMMFAVSSNSRFDSVMRGQGTFTASEYNGFYNIFNTEKGDCFHCHAFGGNLLMTDNKFHNNGLDSATTINDFTDPGRGGITLNDADYGLFRSPSLRNIAVTGPYMHDGRYKTLEQVINFYIDSLKLSPTVDPIMLKPNHANGGVHLSDADKQDLLNFLHTLTDPTFLNNPDLQDPF
jgi:cytochrome c peroxidase